MNTDGNTAALNAYQREQDVLDDQDNALLAAQQELSNDLFDGYFEGNMACVDWIDDYTHWMPTNLVRPEPPKQEKGDE